jgi:RNA polymerase sigma-70 factor (ECF subfamily)
MFVLEPLVPEAPVATVPATFRDLVETYQRPLYYLALDLTGNPHDAEDLSQEVFIRAWRSLAQFRGEATVYTWLRRIALNLYLNQQRRKVWSMLRFFGESPALEQRTDPLPRPDHHTDDRMRQQHIAAALDGLSPRERSAFVLRHYEDLALKDVAEAMGISEGTVKSLLFRATQKLRQSLAFYQPEL